jgi:pantothenate synthetase
MKIAELELAYKKKNILIISHNIVVSLYLAPLAFKSGQEYERYKRTGYCSYAIIRNGGLVKDIIKASR